MKTSIILLSVLTLLASCNKTDIAQKTATESAENQSTVPVQISVKGQSVSTRATQENTYEGALVNTRLTVEVYGYSGLISSNVYEVSEGEDIIVNIPQCKNAIFRAESGNLVDGVFQTGVDGQKDYLYARGEINADWSTLSSQKTPFEITVKRTINKISINKISVNWTNSNYNDKEFRIKRIYLSDVPRFYISDVNGTNASVKAYNSDFTGQKEDIKAYNLGGLSDYPMKSTADDKTYISPNYRLDDQLLDEVDAVITPESPYTTQHVFYSYISNGTIMYPSVRSLSNDNYASIKFPMTTIVLEAEMEGNIMYYRFPVVTDCDTAPTNSHIIFSNLLITNLGSVTQHGAKTYENAYFTVQDWDEDNRDTDTETI